MYRSPNLPHLKERTWSTIFTTTLINFSIFGGQFCSIDGFLWLNQGQRDFWRSPRFQYTDTPNDVKLLTVLSFLIHCTCSYRQCTHFFNNFSFSLIFTWMQIWLISKTGMARIMAIPEVARFSRHLIYAMFSTRASHMVWFASAPRHIYLAFKTTLIQEKNKYIREQLDLLL